MKDPLSDSIDAKGLSSERAQAIVDAHTPRVPREPEGECEPWAGYIHPNGYGRVWHEGRHWQAHRLAYELTHGPIPDGLVIDHLCRNRACVNVAHLEAVTERVNILRGATLQAAFLERTHCLHGHELAEDNVRLSVVRGRWTIRLCRECQRLRQRAARGSTRTNLTEDDKAKVKALLAEGHSQREVARRVGRSQAVVSRVARA